MPPAKINLPSPAMSVLKQYLESHSFDVDVCYWNILMFDLQSKFLPNKNITDDDFVGLSLFTNYWAMNKNDTQTINRLKVSLKSLQPEFIHVGNDIYDKHMHEYAKKTNEFIENTINKLNFSDALYVGVSVNLYQWICATIIGNKIKEMAPAVPIVIGGLGSKDSAIAYLRNFNQFDFAIWGEGENPLLLLSNELTKSNPQLETAPNLVYRKNSEIVASKTSNRIFINLASLNIRPDFSDHFQCYKNSISKAGPPSLPIEAGRGCHWKRCHFCYLNSGYRYRTKPVDIIIDELEFMIQKYEINNFNFLDNDVVGNNLESFERLLDSLIQLKNKYPEFKILIAEIITKGINAAIIKKMSLAGFIHVQIGYESASDTLLKKIEKKNSFSSNLLFIKFALFHRIHIGGVNIIRNLLEETDEDIIECIENLHFLRFFLKRSIFKHKITELAISFSSRYYKKIQNDIEYWNISEKLSELLPQNYIEDKDAELKISEGIKDSYNVLWNHFIVIEQYYLENPYEYEFIRKSSSEIIYTEYHKGNDINKLEFSENSIEWFVLQLCNHSVVSFPELFKQCQSEYKVSITENELKETLDMIKEEKLIYFTTDYSEIVSIVNTDLVK